MEEKSEGTPNPLSPKVEVGPITEPSVLGIEVVEPAPEPKPEPEPETKPKPEPEPEVEAEAAVEIVEVKTKPNARAVDPMIPVQPTPAPSVPTQPVQPVQPVQPATPETPDVALGVVTNMDGSVAENMDPMNRPMQQVPTITEEDIAKRKKKRKRTALIVGVIISLFLAIGCGVMAALIAINLNKVDPVAEAAKKLLSTDAPANVMLDGEIKIDFKNADTAIANLKISIDTEAAIKTMINSSVVNLQANLQDGSSFDVKLSEIYAAKGDLYLKVENVSEALAQLFSNTTAETTEATTEESPAELLNTLGTVEGEWLRIPLNDIDTLFPGGLEGSGLSCAADLISDSLNNSNTITELYSKYPFITSTDKDLTVVSERDPIYQVIINNNFEKFVTEAQNMGNLKSLTSCLGGINANNLAGTVQKLPEIFVEVNDRYNFTRLYFTLENSEADTVVDLRFSYPTNVNVPEPLEYKDFSEIIQVEGEPPVIVN